MNAKNYKVEVAGLNDKDENGYKVDIPAFNATLFLDDLTNLQEMIDVTIESAIAERQKNGLPIPKPDAEEASYSGRISLRIPRRLHKSLTNQAKEQKVSLNQYLLYLLSKEVA